MPSPIRQDDLLLRLIKDTTEIRAALRRVVANLPLFDISNENTPPVITANQNNYVPGNYDVLRLSSDAPRTITGFSGGVKGRFLHLFNVGSYEITLANLSLLSLSANQIRSFTGFDIILNAGGELVLYYDFSTRTWISSYASSANRISCQLRITADHFLADSDPWDIEWQTAVDTGNFFNAAAPTIVTIPETGWYSIDLQVCYEAVSSAAGRFTSIRDNTNYLLAIDSRPGINDGVETIFVHIGKSSIYRVKGSTITVNVVHLSAAGLNIFATKNGLWTGPAYTEFNISKL